MSSVIVTVVLLAIVCTLIVFNGLKSRRAPATQSGEAARVGDKPAGVRAKPNYPLLTMEMIETGGRQVTAPMAVRLYKEYMLKVGYLDPQEINDHGEYFLEDMREHAESLREDVAHEIESFAPLLLEFKEGISDLNKQLKSLKSDAERKEVRRIGNSTA